MGEGAIGIAYRCLRRRWGRTDGGGQGLRATGGSGGANAL